ncbi:MAG: DNA polymerase I [Chitinophagales bacterium]
MNNSMQDDKRLFLLDAFALIYRAYFSFIRNPLINSKGQDVSATTGYVNILYDLLSNQGATHLAVVFDPPGGTFRHKEFPFYKANREEMPEGIRSALPYIKAITKAFNVPMLEVANFEADDVIGTIAKKAARDGFTVFMVTPDKDYGQLVEENIKMYKPAHLGRPVTIMGVKEICDLWGIERTEQVIDILGLMGDSSDNIPGVKGIGAKTAAKLLKEYDNIENLIANIDKLKGASKKKMETDKENAIISKRLATIVLDVPVDYHPNSYHIDPINKEALKEIFVELEFRNLGKRILGDDYQVNKASRRPKGARATAPTGQLDMFANEMHQELLPDEEVEAGQTIENIKKDYHSCETPEKRADLMAKLLQQKKVAFDTETTGLDANQAELVGMSFSWKTNEGYYVPVPADQKEAQAIVEEFRPFFESKSIEKIGQNIKYDMLLLKWYDMEVKGKLHDTMLAHYLIEPDMRHNMTILSETYLNYSPVPIEDLIGKKGKKQGSMRDVELEKITQYAAEDADLTWQLNEKFEPKIADATFSKLYAEVEMPLVPVLTELEYNGVNLDVKFLEEYSKELGIEVTEMQKGIFKEAGVEFNIDSPLQMGKILFDRMEIPYKGKKTKTGRYSTNEQTLTDLEGDHPIIADILNYRELVKLKSTYIDALPQLVNPKTGRIHSSFNQAVAATGRLSSANPNLQNIPIRTERGRQIRKAFIPRSSDFVMMAADYSQIELRLMAVMSQDKVMLSAFQEGLDVHSTTAARVFGVSLEEVSTDMRRKAKMVNFGLIYGISIFGLAQRLAIPRREAKEIFDEYWKQFEGIKQYMVDAVTKAQEAGYAETILGRRRYLKDIHSRNHTVRKFAERNAINSPIQGSAADLIKVAMVDVHAEMQKRELKSKMILQVHDELVFDAHKSEVEELTALVKDKMTNAIKLEVPLSVDVGLGKDWLEAH